MTDPSLALQTLIYARLIANPEVTSLVPAENISDRSTRPNVFPCIIIGEGHTLYADDVDRFHEQAFMTLHVWTREPGLEQAKRIAGAARTALKQAPWSVAGHTAHGITIASARFLRDPSGEHGHAVIEINAVLQVASDEEFGEIFP